MLIIKNKTLIKLLTFNFAGAMALFPFILVADENMKKDQTVINHEKIHLRQQREMLVIPFLMWYWGEYLILRIKYKNHRLAYRNISFEKEAYANESNLHYLSKRPFWAFLKYVSLK